MELEEILLRPLITEKSMDLASRGGYTFQVAKKATKNQIKAAAEDQFKVKVVKVKTITVPGKTRRFGRRRILVKIGLRKKAIIFLTQGQKLDIFEVPKGE